MKQGLVIGAGASGVAALRECVAHGLDAVCFEGADEIGGLWRFTAEESHSSVYRSTVINTSKEMTAFSVFPPPKEMACFMHHSQLVTYIDLYVDHFALRGHIQLKTRVHCVKPAHDFESTGAYQADYTVGSDPTMHSKTFGFVIVCTGHHSKPKTPSFPGQASFQNTQLHTHSYKDHNGFEGKNVVIIGVGNSGLDVAVELSRVAKQTYLSTRNGTWIASRQGKFGLPSDFIGVRRDVWARPWEELDTLLAKKAQENINLELYGLQPKHRYLAAHISINGDVPNRILTGTLAVVPNVKQIKPTSVVFDNDKEVPCDVIIYATGYEIGFPFLDPSCGVVVHDNEVSMYKFVFPPTSQKGTLSFVGLIQPIGSIL